MAYNELIKNFNKVRDYMRDFYIYGFKSREAYTRKSTRSYDDEKRRIESWLGEYMKFRQDADGKKVFLSIDSRVPDTIRFIRHGRRRALQTEILPFILSLWIFFLTDKNDLLWILRLWWTDI